MWERTICEVVSVYATVHQNPKMAEKYASRLVDSDAKVRAYIYCGKLKAAYLLAVKLKNIELVQEILEEARVTDQATVVQLCIRYLELNPPVKNSDSQD